jgi:UDP-N-acetylmuramoyl-tripeptide--D-alanyl-D-alanine ligase
MRSLKKVRTIGITGSYGKTSTKEFLYAILSRKFNVAITEGNNNTNIGVAYTVLNKVSDDYDYFICEMGAYKIGEIKEMCDIAKPEIGILTGINEQHIELFGSIENTITAKFELIESLPEHGLAIINEKLKIKKAEDKSKVKSINYFSINLAKNIKVYSDYSEFEYQGKMFRLNLPGRHYIENLMSVIMVSEHLGMTLDEIRDAISEIKPTEYMIRRSAGINNSVFIDDSYSANPDGVIAALDYIEEAYPDHKKIIVFPGFIELGNESEKIHKDIFDQIRNKFNVAFILDTKHSKLYTGNGCKFIFEKDFNKAAKMLKAYLEKDTVILFESRGAGAVMRKLKKFK